MIHTILLTCAGLLAGVSGALADTTNQRPKASWSVHLDVVAQHHDERARLVMVLPLVSGGCAESVSTHQGLITTVRICDASAPGQAPVVSFDIDRVARDQTGTANDTIKASVQMTTGRRATVGRLEHADGGTIHVSATLVAD